MNKIPLKTTNEYDNISGSNPSLITAGLPSGSIMTNRLIQSSSKIKQNHHFNQNQATAIAFQKNDHSQCTILSHRTISDTYLNLSRKDINDVMKALHTLARYVKNDINNDENHPLTMLYSKSTNHTFKSSNQANSSSHCYYYHHHPRYSIRNRRHSLSSDRCLNHHHNVIKPMYLYPGLINIIL